MIAAIYAVLAFILVLSATRHAEATCAWVLWFGSGKMTTAELLPMAAFESRENCLTDKAFRESQIKSGEFALLLCLPDTVDPRGPKGGVR